MRPTQTRYATAFSIPEYRISTCAVLNGFFTAAAGARYFNLERRNPRIAFGNRQGVKVLLRQLRHKIAGARGQCDVVGIHDDKLARCPAGVNRSLAAAEQFA